ncbi:uncharacterized protein TRUGW13939_00018 [Talaromyces rugulosus]|uniref:Major facilitator superfamily (MFS) profile domain-containing protein n=1 Tax=Talaromyces rugulosus TaxID=121627 RepID=A0A7H8QG86_TALRU|nr:uncharacterized protein TRUGW13939_00018 [Talaromyces rugulosus]QKX52947.1 hypothetical protein TRUGW13939_00018 [Talaromyces rugulosus]
MSAVMRDGYSHARELPWTWTVYARPDDIHLEQYGAGLSADQSTKKAGEVNKLEALSFQYTKEEEKRLLPKIDIIVVGYVSGAYLLAYMDRGNIGNANTAGMSKDLGIDDSQYQWLLTVLYLGYILFDWQTIFYNNFPARYYVSTVVMIWGIIASDYATAQNFGGMLVLGLLLGIFELSYSPGLGYFFSFFYLRGEMGRRLGWYVSIAPLAASFAGAFAFFVTEYKHAIAGWRALFLVEGFPAILVGLFGYCWLPSNLQDCQFLTEREKKIALARMVRSFGDKDRGHSINVMEFFWSLMDMKNWIPTLMYFSFNISYSSLPIYVPTILTGMGLTNLNAQGLSAPPYVFAAIVVLIVGYMSDYYNRQGIFLAICKWRCRNRLPDPVPCGAGCGQVLCHLPGDGRTVPVHRADSLVGVNNGDDSKRGAGFVLMNFVGQCGPLVGTHIFPASEGPFYQEGFYISFRFCLFAVLLAGVHIWWLNRLNKQLDDKYGPVTSLINAEDEIDEEMYQSETFRYVL